MKVNPEKCHLLINENCNTEIKISGNIIENVKCKKLLGMKIESKLSLKAYVKDLYKKARHKMLSKARFTPYMGLQRKLTLFNVYFKSQVTKKGIHERCLRITYNFKNF